MRVLLLVVIFLPLLITQSTRPSKFLALTHVTLIDVTADQALKAVKPDQTVVLDGDRIISIGQTGKVRLPENAQVVDTGGRYMIPGLWDMHVHSMTERRPEYFFPLFLANGITGIRDMGGSFSFERINQIRDKINAGTLAGPRVVAAGKILDGPAARPDVAISITTPEAARLTVRMFHEAGADFIAVHDGLSREAYLAIVEAAKKEKIPVAGAVPFSMSAAEVSELGQRSIEHMADVLVSGSRDVEVLRAQLRSPINTPFNSSQLLGMRIEMKAATIYDERKTKSLFARFANRDTWQCPTLVVGRTSTFENNERLNSDSRLLFIPAEIRNNWNNSFNQQILAAGSIEQRRVRFQKTLQAVGAMQQAGVGIIAGTDALNPYVFPGFSLHDELVLLVEAGLSPLEALRAATINPAKFLDMQDSLGTIEKGKLADLVLLDANPLDNIANTQRIEAVVANGRYYPYEKLRRLLANAEAAAKK